MALSKLVTVVAVIALVLTASSAEDKQLSVYAPQNTFVVRVTDHDDREYADLMAVVAPLSKITLKVEGETARLSGGLAQGLFVQGENSARIGQKRVRFPGKIFLIEGRLHVPVVALPALLQELTGLRSELHENGRRLFVENTQTSFSVELKKGESTEMVLGFPLRVNPTISQEGNNVRMVFRREPVVMTANSLSFNDPHLPALHFAEVNGTAEVTVNGSAPLMVTFSDQGKTLSVKLAPTAPAAAPAVATAPPAQPPATTTPDPSPAVAPAPPVTTTFPFDNVRYFVMIDPGHGGNDPGVKFSTKVIEKDITLALAKRLRTELQNRGIPAVLARESDVTLSNEQRAGVANGQRTALFVTLHVGSLGSGVRVYATVMPKTEPVQGPFIPWHRAQESYRERSMLLARAVANEINKKVSARMLSAPIPPLHAIAAPAIALEVAPPTVGAPAEDFDKAAYQQAIVVGIANAIVNTRNKLEEMR